MSERHLSAERLEQYVIGALSEPEASEVERHVAACPACEARLMNEASLELAFAQVASTRRVEPSVRRGVSRVVPAAVVGALAMAAAAVVWLTPAAPVDSRAAAAPPPQASYETGDASTATAQLDGDALIGMRD